MSYLVLIRHGLSEYNEKGLWCGWADPPLTKKGRQEAQEAARQIASIPIDIAFTSPLIRVKETLEEIKKELGIETLKTVETSAINERNYGDFTGKNKWEVKKQIGEEEFLKLRRGWDYKIPNGESLKDVYNRIAPYYKNSILPYILEEKNILIVSSGNALRALVKYLENISDENISKVELGFGEVWIYTLDKSGMVMSKQIKTTQAV